MFCGSGFTLTDTGKFCSLLTTVTQNAAETIVIMIANTKRSHPVRSCPLYIIVRTTSVGSAQIGCPCCELSK